MVNKKINPIYKINKNKKIHKIIKNKKIKKIPSGSYLNKHSYIKSTRLNEYFLYLNKKNSKINININMNKKNNTLIPKNIKPNQFISHIDFKYVISPHSKAKVLRHLNSYKTQVLLPSNHKKIFSSYIVVTKL